MAIDIDRESGKQRPAGRPTWAEIDLGALTHNYQALASLLSPSALKGSSATPPRLIPVIKADAYGHGAIQAARTLAAAGVTAFAVAIVEEGVALRAAGVREEILVLGGAWPGQETELIRHQLIPAISSINSLQRIDAAARAASTPITIHIQIDTGMERDGVAWDRIIPFLQALQQTSHLRVAGTFSHLANADEEDLSYAHEQIRRFKIVLKAFSDLGLNPGEIHFDSSAGLLYCEETRSWSARPGIALYGYGPAPMRNPIQLRPVLTLKSILSDTRCVKAGESIGYNRRFFATREMRVALVPIGYADGYRRGLTGQGRVIIRDRWAEVLGAVSMDMIVVDLSNLPDAVEGDEVLVLGSSPNCCMDAGVMARMCDTIPYEILCGIGPRVPRIAV
jgi:alanine racemase